MSEQYDDYPDLIESVLKQPPSVGWAVWVSDGRLCVENAETGEQWYFDRDARIEKMAENLNAKHEAELANFILSEFKND